MNPTNNFIALAEHSTTVSMNERQTPLTDTYRNGTEGAKEALVVDFATTSCGKSPASSPLYSEVMLTKHMPYSVPVGVHSAVGGECDFPTPGDILCGALSACMDTTIRIIANKLGIKLTTLAVSVAGTVDVRGTLRLDKGTPVGFQTFDITVDIEATNADEKLIEVLINAAEYSCIILQTLRNPPSTTLRTQIRCGDERAVSSQVSEATV
ncbi:OsmC family protein [Aestuariicella hydrocarbonica]|uniref:OsmC family protein n=1 Tax=Pseudomaricurvus hydrocarbonicus TaxID=1470433 RepID=A0A9E5MN19_9GAMM|nr:OsmC family protein [Aestuariicella hydrocarbonica]NHO67212.1 OsmC family protein [Aestuariicella hydrocarbonica]